MRTTILVAGVVLVVASVLGLLVGSHRISLFQVRILSVNDSPITVSDGSIKITKNDHFGHNTPQPTQDHWIKDNNYYVATYISVDGCPAPGCFPASPSLVGEKNWVLTLNDQTQLSQQPRDPNQINIHLSEAAKELYASGTATLTLKSAHFEPATLSVGGKTLNLTCPKVTPGPYCVMKIHYCKNGKCN